MSALDFQKTDAALTSEQEINDVLASIVMEKISTCAVDMIECISDLQILLKNKLRPAASCPPQEPQGLNGSSSRIPCASVFLAVNEWKSGEALRLGEAHKCGNGAKLCGECCDSLIILHCGKKYSIELRLEAVDKNAGPISVEFILRSGCGSVCNVRLLGELKWETPVLHSDSLFEIKLLSPGRIRIAKGEVIIDDKTRP